MLESSDSDFYSAIEPTSSPNRVPVTRNSKVKRRKIEPIEVISLLDDDIEVIDDIKTLSTNAVAGSNITAAIEASSCTETSTFESEFLGGGFTMESLKTTEETINNLKKIEIEVQDIEVNLDITKSKGEEKEKEKEKANVSVHAESEENTKIDLGEVKMDAKIEPPQMDLKVEDKKIEISIERSPKAMHSKDLSNLNQITSPKLSTNLSVTTSPTKSVKKKKSAALMDDFFALAPKKKKKTKRKVLESNEEISNNDVSLLTSSVVSVTQAAPLLQSLPSPNDIVSSTLDKHAETEKVGPNSEEVNKVSSPLAGEPIAEYQEILVGVTDEEVEDDFKIDPTPFDDLSDNESGYIFNEENEGKRSYQLLVKPVVSTISKKVPMDDFFVKTNGNVKFTEIFNNEILPQINQVTKNAFSSPNELALIWVEGKTEIKYFFKPSTLRIEPKNMELFSFDGTEEQECTKLTILVIPSQDVKTFSALYPEYFRDKKAEATNYLIEEARREKEKAISTSDIELSEGEDDNVDLSKPVGQRIGGLPKAVIDKVGGNEETDQYFVIGLKGKDNKRLEVKVCSNTSMNQLLDYFLLKKKYNKINVDKSKAKFIFDDEMIGLEELVGETELEEDFEVQVVLPN